MAPPPRAAVAFLACQSLAPRSPPPAPKPTEGFGREVPVGTPSACEGWWGAGEKKGWGISLEGRAPRGAAGALRVLPVTAAGFWLELSTGDTNFLASGSQSIYPRGAWCWMEPGTGEP